MERRQEQAGKSNLCARAYKKPVWTGCILEELGLSSHDDDANNTNNTLIAFIMYVQMHKQNHSILLQCQVAAETNVVIMMLS